MWITSLLLSVAIGNGQVAAPKEAAPVGLPATMSPPTEVVSGSVAAPATRHMWAGIDTSGFLVGDRAFPRFIAPVSNPVLAKDPRASTYLRGLIISDSIPNDHPFAGGDFQAVAVQAGLALSERLTIIADKDGYAWLNPNGTVNTQGFLNLGAGLKYTFLRDVDNQFLLSGGFMYEIPSGARQVYNGYGDGTTTVFSTFGKEWNERWHLLGTVGYQFPLDSNWNSSFYFTSFHLDYQVNCWFYPIVELNWFHWVQGGNHGLPPSVGEVDGLINLGTSGVAGNNFVTVAIGGRFVLNDHWSAGAVWETPLTNREDFMRNRVTVDLIFRY